MIIKKYPAPPIETAASRYDRDWLHVPDSDTAGNDDDRHDRTLLQQTVERKSRRYVDDNVSAVTGGSPVFDPNEPDDPSDPGDTDNNIVFTDDFSGTVLDDRWNVTDGAASTPPLKVAEGEEYFQLITKEPISTGDVEVTIQGEFNNDDVVSVGFSNQTPDGSMNGGPYANILMESPDHLTVLGGSYLEGLIPNLSLSDVEKATFRIQGGTATVLVNDVVAAEGNAADIYDTANVLHPTIMMQGAGSITSVSVKVLDNGGGTPEPEDSEVPPEDSGALWIDTFEGPEMNARWSVPEGGAEIDPLRIAADQEYFRLISEEPTPSLNAEVTAEFNTNGTTVVSLGFWIKDDSGEWDDGPYVNVEVSPLSLYVSGNDIDFDASSLLVSGIQSMTTRVQDGTMTILINGETAEGLSVPVPVWAAGKELHPMLVLMGTPDATVPRISVKTLE